MVHLMEDLLFSFQGIGMSPSETVLKRCSDLCSLYNMTADDLVDHWAAYTATFLKGAPPSLQDLEKMERRELKPQRNNTILSTYECKSPEPVEKPKSPEIAVINSPSTRFINREGSGTVVYTIGQSTMPLESISDCKFLRIDYNRITEKQMSYMYDATRLRTNAFNDITNQLLDEIVEANPSLTPLPEHQQDFGEVILRGRIYPTNTEERLNLNCIKLETPLEGDGRLFSLNVSKLPKVSVFPGQVVIVKGMMHKGTVSVSDIFTLEFPPKLPTITDENLRILIAAGPFTLPDNLLYEPLQFFIQQVRSKRPNVVILLGPFVDTSHSTYESYDKQFENLIEHLVDGFSTMDLHVIIVPSHQEAHHHNVFPTPPFNVPTAANNIHFVQNPCQININGLLVGTTTSDILFHLSKREFHRDLSTQNGSDRMQRLSGHILNQHCFYPLHPPDSDINVDYQLLQKYGLLKTKPDVFVVPSNLRYFIKQDNGTVIVNPERLVKGNVAGTFAVLEVPRGTDLISERIYGEIIKI